MRRDEWDKWLEAQFLDNQPETAEAILPPKSVQTETPVKIAASFVPPTPSQAVQTPTAPTNNQEPIHVPSPSPATTRPTGVDGLVDDVEVPSIERYFPFLRKKMEKSEPAPEPVQIESHAQESQPVNDAVAEETVQVIAEGIPASIEEVPVEVVEPLEAISAPVGDSSETKVDISTEPSVKDVTVQPQVKVQTEGPEPAVPVVAVESSVKQPALSLEIEGDTETKPKSGVKRSKHARNVKPADVAPELDADAFWSLVPRHLQTLIALGSDETARNSYKREFKESRLELIQNLLDPTLSLEDTARLLNVCPTTVRRYTNKGLLTHQRTIGDQRRFKLSDVLAFLEAQSRAAR